MRALCLFSSASLLLVFATAALGQAPLGPEVGEEAPDFTLKDQDGRDLKLSSLRGKKNVLMAFYPKDFTGG